MSNNVVKAFILVYGEPYGELLHQDLGKPGDLRALEQTPVSFGKNKVRDHDIYQLISSVAEALAKIEAGELPAEPAEASESASLKTGRKKSKAKPQQEVEDSEAENVKKEPTMEAVETVVEEAAAEEPVEAEGE